MTNDSTRTFSVEVDVDRIEAISKVVPLHERACLQQFPLQPRKVGSRQEAAVKLPQRLLRRVCHQAPGGAHLQAHQL